ncbi:hypothetical protein [Pseudomonas gessardii]|jgi:hypothetical protein|uniref:Uncharacterized protein n=1 Tax=Pseudomonas gessardii TaxID=78544 RepID=A0A7Y1QLE5_9PSED|nr:hypothetical protein [Pseudomonas gessardii]NNA95477.1 hypothetical protein [Pseudomonas gessardii]
MQRLQRQPTLTPSGLSRKDDAVFYSVYANNVCPDFARYRVVPAGRNFFHILEVPSGRIKGFRSDHNKACALAKELETLLRTMLN